MPWGNVRISNVPGRKIYIDGLYDTAIGIAPGPFVVDFGRHTFETLNSNMEVDWRVEVIVSAGRRDISCALERIR